MPLPILSWGHTWFHLILQRGNWRSEGWVVFPKSYHQKVAESTFESRINPQNKTRAVMWPPSMDLLILHSHLCLESSLRDSGSHLLSGARAALSNRKLRPRSLRNLPVLLRSLLSQWKAGTWLRHHWSRWKQVSCPRCVTWTLSSVCWTQVCVV